MNLLANKFSDEYNLASQTNLLAIIGAVARS